MKTQTTPTGATICRDGVKKIAGFPAGGSYGLRNIDRVNGGNARAITIMHTHTVIGAASIGLTPVAQ